MSNLIAQMQRRARRLFLSGMRVLVRAGLISVLCTALAYAEPARVQVLLSESGNMYADVVAGLERQLSIRAPGQVSLNVKRISGQPQQLTALLASRPTLIVTVGMQATALALRSTTPVPIVSLLISEASYDALLSAAANRPHAATRSAIFLDQPMSRQLNLLQLLLPHARHIATLESPASRTQRFELAALCKQRGLTLSSQSVASGSNPIKALTPLMEHADALLALADPNIFNRNNLQAILLTTYRGEVPVLGFSKAYVRAGALSAVHSTALQIGAQAGDWFADMAHSGNWELGAPRYPAYYSISVNRQVAQSLGIHVTDDVTLLTQLREKDIPTP